MQQFKKRNHAYSGVQRKLHGLRLAFLLLPLVCFSGGAVLRAAEAPKQDAVPSKATAKPNPADFVGAETCETCHSDVTKTFANNPHSKLALAHGGKGVTCEGCHGPGKAHVDGGGDVTKIFRFTKASAQDVDDKCLDCHKGQHANFERSAHGEGNVSCIGCHSVHSGEMDKPHLLKTSQPKLCYSCHAEVKTQFHMPFHHKVDEGLMNCSDCHNPHGTFEKKGLKSNAHMDSVCMKCHTETAGPFVFEHPVVKTEGCVSCHTPHGSPNPRLLTRSNVNSLCLQCHTASSFSGAPGIPSFHNQAVQYQACTVCHTNIHGSNVSNVFFK